MKLDRDPALVAREGVKEGRGIWELKCESGDAGDPQGADGWQDLVGREPRFSVGTLTLTDAGTRSMGASKDYKFNLYFRTRSDSPGIGKVHMFFQMDDFETGILDRGGRRDRHRKLSSWSW